MREYELIQLESVAIKALEIDIFQYIDDLNPRQRRLLVAREESITYLSNGIKELVALVRKQNDQATTSRSA